MGFMKLGFYLGELLAYYTNQFDIAKAMCWLLAIPSGRAMPLTCAGSPLPRSRHWIQHRLG